MKLPACIVAGIESDSHTWNLVFMQLLLEGEGREVSNLGCCVPPTDLADAIKANRPELVVISTVNGHGATQGKALIEGLRRALGFDLPRIVIGGRLTTSEALDAEAAASLREAGYDDVFVGPNAIDRFHAYLTVRSHVGEAA